MFSWILNFLVEFWNVSCMMAPWVLFGFLFGGIIAVLVPESFIKKHLGGRGIIAILKAALIGVPLPLCSCGVIPTAATLKRQVVGNGAVASFITSTPQIGFSSFIPAWQVINPLTAIVKALFAFISGVSVGILVNLFTKNEPDAANTKVESATPVTIALPQKENKIIAIIRYAFGTLMGDVGGTLLFGLLVSALISLALPDDFAAEYVAGSLWAKPLMILVSMPLYVCTNAVIPIGAMLLLKGFSPGTVMVFLIAGPSCSAPMIAAFWKIVGKKATFIYLATMIICTLLVGWGLDVFAAATPESLTAAHCHQDEANWFEHLCALFMIILILHSILKKYFISGATLTPDQGQILLAVSEMECGHCKQVVEKTLNSMQGVQVVNVDLANGQALVKAPESLLPQILSELEQAGHKASKI